MDSDENTATPAQSWWGENRLDAGMCLHRRIGVSQIWLTRDDHEWRFAALSEPENRDSTVFGEEIVPATAFPEAGAEIRRLGFRATAPTWRMSPRLADRPVVIRPTQPIALPAREELVLYFTSPLWLQVEVGKPLVPFVEISLQRPSDTWFGPNTREGEICYALRTSARLHLADLPRRPHRAFTELHVLNLADEPLEIEHLLVPLPLMSLYATADGQLWTQVVTFERRASDDQAELKLGNKPPAHAQQPEIIAHPRGQAPRAHLFRAFGGLIGGR